MYVDHRELKKPKDENIKIWRYLDFTKLFSLIEKRALFFCRADQLPDPFEGSYTKINLLLRKLILKSKHESGGLTEAIMNSLPKQYKNFRKFFFINCWSMNTHESFAMWRLFLKSNEGVAIQSTFRRFKDSLSSSEDVVSIGKVNYIDYNRELIPERNLFVPFTYKRKSFEYEQELRGVIAKFAFKEDNGKQSLDLEADLGLGLYETVDLDKLIECIYVAPTAPAWFKKLVESVVDKFGLTKEVKQSSLEDDPVY